MTDARITQGGAYVGVQRAPNPARITQGGMYVGVKLIPPARITQGGAYVGVQRAPNPARITQGGMYVGVLTLRPGCLTNEAQCWRIARADGAVFCFTAHDRPLMFRGELYNPCASLSSSAYQQTATFGEAGNMDLSGVIAAGHITQSDLRAGKFDGAQVEVWRVDWTDPTRADMLAAGNCGSLEFGTTEFKFEVTTAGERLQQRPILQPVMPTCRFKLGDNRCAVDLEARRVTGSVTGLTLPSVRIGSQRRIFSDASRTEPATYFQLGRITWTSGANIGVSIDIKSFDGAQFVLEQAMEFDIGIGDTYSAVPGCPRTFEACDQTFGNAINFGGFPHLRGTDDLQQTPEQKQ